MIGKSWTNKELSYLRAHAGKVPAKQLAEHLGRSLSSVTGFAIRNGISIAYEPAPRDWTETEIYLIEKMPVSIAAEILKRTRAEIKFKRHQMGMCGVEQ